MAGPRSAGCIPTRGAACITGIVAIDISDDNRTWYDEGLDQFRNNKCAGIEKEIVDDGIYTGQDAESGRDQGHPQFALGNLAQAAEMAWNQGLDLHSENANLLLKGVEYLAR